jgi:hypothetical protein
MIQHRNVPIQTQATVELPGLPLDAQTESAFWERLCERALRALAQLLNCQEEMARPEGFEPPTPRFVVWCSIQLSYGR